ncbi:hypothetical protein BDZ89DRAFT_1056649 [Hymenopellis radicata]|nr:hypothetical protein BDZ89DRAFT_1056649 [Hymenopellis radicata]
MMVIETSTAGYLEHLGICMPSPMHSETAMRDERPCATQRIHQQVKQRLRTDIQTSNQAARRPSHRMSISASSASSCVLETRRALEYRLAG